MPTGERFFLLMCTCICIDLYWIMAGSLCGLVDMLGSKKEGVGSLSYSSSLAPSFALCFHFFYFRRSCLLLGGVTHSPHRSKLIRGDARLMQTFPQRHTLRFSLSLFFLSFSFSAPKKDGTERSSKRACILH